jgi:hypothetical protein
MIRKNSGGKLVSQKLFLLVKSYRSVSWSPALSQHQSYWLLAWLGMEWKIAMESPIVGLAQQRRASWTIET